MAMGTRPWERNSDMDAVVARIERKRNPGAVLDPSRPDFTLSTGVGF
jgi:hypothetical protein